MDDIFRIIELLDDSKRQLVINNINDKHIQDIENDLLLRINVLNLKETFLKTNTVEFENKLLLLERKLNTDSIMIIDLELKSIQKLYMNLLHKKYELQKRVSRYEYFIEKLSNKHVNIFTVLLRDLKISFDKILLFKDRMDAGDGVNGVINKLILMKNKQRMELQDDTSSSDSDNILKNEQILSNYDEIWDVYNKTREIFEKIFGINCSIDDIDLSWEDLISNNMTTEEAYSSKNIKTLEDLKMYINSRN